MQELRQFIWTCLLLSFGVPFSHAEVRLPQVLSNFAVLQRNAPVHIWGWATPQAHLTVRLHDQTVAAVTDEYGEWSAYLNPEQAGGPYTLKVEGDGTAERTDIMVGDIWLASGQSNMEFPLQGFADAPLKDSQKEIAAANNRRLRLLLVPHKGADVPQNDLIGTWTECTSETAAKFSAVAYFFAREIAEKEHVTVGLIDATWGGTPVDSWISMDMLGNNPALYPAFHSRALFVADEGRLQELDAIDRQTAEAAQKAGVAVPPVPHRDWHPSQISWLPAGLYNGMIAPLTPYSIKGFLWYQGETNSRPDRFAHYATAFPSLIYDWRARFAQGDLPFLYVQISAFDSPAEHWGVVRDAQRRALALRNTSMTVSIDVGEEHNVHPADKQTVAARLALAARGMVYGEKVDYESPLMHQVTNELGALRVWFDHADGLHSNGKPIENFEIAGGDHKFMAAQARIEGLTVVVSANEIETPQYVRYAWRNWDTGSLWNKAGLPAGTFTSEDLSRPDIQ